MDRQQEVFHSLSDCSTRWTHALSDFNLNGDELVKCKQMWSDYTQLYNPLIRWVNEAMHKSVATQQQRHELFEAKAQRLNNYETVRIEGFNNIATLTCQMCRSGVVPGRTTTTDGAGARRTKHSDGVCTAEEQVGWIGAVSGEGNL